jgi:NADPH-dependent 2,4-dienoyl-CoA reductase/sulfur reductase-like enzyme
VHLQRSVSTRILVIGGVAAGMSAASQAKRRRPDAEVVVLERGPHVSYGACGMPYNIADASRAIDDLVVVTPERFRNDVPGEPEQESSTRGSRSTSMRARWFRRSFLRAVPWS